MLSYNISHLILLAKLISSLYFVCCNVLPCFYVVDYYYTFGHCTVDRLSMWSISSYFSYCIVDRLLYVIQLVHISPYCIV